MRERLDIQGFFRIIIPPVIYVILQRIAGYVVVFGMTLMSFGVMTGILRGRSFSVDLDWNEMGFVAMALAALVSIPLFLSMKNRDELQYPSDYRYEPVARWRYVYVPVVGFLMAVGTNQLISLLNIDRFFPGYEETSQTLYAMNVWAELVVLGILVPIVEELIFRAVVYERIRRYCSVTAAALWTSFFFGVYHGNMSQGIYAFLLSLLMVYVKEKYHTMTAPILFHMSANIYSVLATETALVDWVTESLELYLAVMVLSFAISLLAIWRIQEEVAPEQVKKNREWHNNSENYGENW